MVNRIWGLKQLWLQVNGHAWFRLISFAWDPLSYSEQAGIEKFKMKIRGWIKKFWNYSHISLIIRRIYIKLIQSTKQPFPNFAMMSEWRSTHANTWSHHLMTSCNSDPKKNLTEINLFKERTITNFYASFGDYRFKIKMILIEHYQEK